MLNSKLLIAPDLGVEARRESEEITEREVTTCWPTSPRSGASCSPPSRRGSVQLIVERVYVIADALEVRIRAEGLVRLVAELRQRGHQTARAA